MIHGPVDEMSSTGNSLSVSVSSDTCSGLTSVSARSIGRLRLQVLPRILHGLEIGRDLHQRDADTAQLADVDELLDSLHQFLRTFLPVSHYRFVTRCVLLLLQSCPCLPFRLHDRPSHGWNRPRKGYIV